ncbi:hypothetical protein EJC49_25475 [Aquibium carbonis]|uniref:Uncharacterized protein n=1 Tax=Aquibium carbonis TaxID=2495581 RepID=A0A429YAL7_9HYPH|nr:hypothetical protein [Aquibium carbonis]RST78410.1 hypothetical protein EJC49_25475 [Aquibium carbonis]
MRRLLVLAAFVALASASGVSPSLAASQVHYCPPEARGIVSHTGDASWTATNQSSRVTAARVEMIGGQPSLVCVYRMFGGDYWIHRRPEAPFMQCSGGDMGLGRVGFSCVRG